MAYINNSGLFGDESPVEKGSFLVEIVGTGLIVLTLACLIAFMIFGPRPHHYRYAVNVPDGDGEQTYHADFIERLPDGGIRLDDGTEIHGSYTIVENP